MKILLVETEDAVVIALSKTLRHNHCAVDIAQDGEVGWAYGTTYAYDLMLINVALPKVNGIQLCQRFRAEGYLTPILLLNAQSSSAATVQGLDAGADDYVVQPYDLDELAARVRALLRRGSANPFPLLTWGDLCLNPSTYEVTYGSHALSLTTKEYELLELLLRDSQRMLSTDDILDKLWSTEEFPAEATVRSHMRRLRCKLAAAGAPTDLIVTLHGRGYCLKVAAPDAELPALTATDTALEKYQKLYQNIKIMAMDEDQEWLKTLPHLLQPWGFKTTTLADPQQFWTVLEAVRPDVLVLEVGMPQFSSFELCQALREDLGWQQLLIIFISHLSELSIQNQAFAVGGDDYLHKPFTELDLAQRIFNRFERIRAWLG